MFKGKAPPKSEGGNYTLIEAGSHPAVLVALIDLGTHQRTAKDPKKGERTYDAHDVYLCWELVDQPQPGLGVNHTIGDQFTLSFHEMGRLRKLAEGWRGRKYNEGDDIDYTKFLGHACMVNVTHKASKDGKKTYHNIAGVTALPKVGGKAIEIPAAKLLGEGGKGLIWTISGPGCPIQLPAWLPRLYGQELADVIKVSREWQGGTDTHPEVPVGPGGEEIAEGDEIPF